MSLRASLSEPCHGIADQLPVAGSSQPPVPASIARASRPSSVVSGPVCTDALPAKVLMRYIIEHLEHSELAEVYAASRAPTLISVPVIDPLGPDFAYIQVANHIAARIELCEIKHKLPADRVLAEEYDVTYQNVLHSMQILRERGLV